jgi:hypothetical protein
MAPRTARPVSPLCPIHQSMPISRLVRAKVRTALPGAPLTSCPSPGRSNESPAARRDDPLWEGAGCAASPRPSVFMSSAGIGGHDRDVKGGRKARTRGPDVWNGSMDVSGFLMTDAPRHSLPPWHGWQTSYDRSAPDGLSDYRRAGSAQWSDPAAARIECSAARETVRCVLESLPESTSPYTSDSSSAGLLLPGPCGIKIRASLWRSFQTGGKSDAVIHPGCRASPSGSS